MSVLPGTWTDAILHLSPRADPVIVGAAAQDVLNRWQEPSRSYHTPKHLSEMLGALTELSRSATVRTEPVLVAAAWLHDAVYVPGRPDNETLAAALGEEMLTALGVGDEHRRQVRELILMTTDHDLPPPGSWAARFHDADLWILSAPPARFDDYCRQVRQEFASVPDAAYAAGRIAVLEPLVRRARTYATAYGQEQWEAAGRANVSRELQRLAVR